MKVLEYKESNLEKIAQTKERPLDEITAQFERANELQMTIFSTIDYMYFNTHEVTSVVSFMDSRILHKWYDITSGPDGEYLDAKPKD